jgi:hypothetical protein
VRLARLHGTARPVTRRRDVQRTLHAYASTHARAAHTLRKPESSCILKRSPLGMLWRARKLRRQSAYGRKGYSARGNRGMQSARSHAAARQGALQPLWRC